MAQPLVAILDTSRSNTQQIIGNVSKSVTMNGKPLVLNGSVGTKGGVVLTPQTAKELYVEGRRVAHDGDRLSDGSIILPRKE